MKRRSVRLSGPLAAAIVRVCAFGIFLLYSVPLALIALNSIKDQTQSSVIDLALPSPAVFGNYLTVLGQPNFLRAFLNDAFVSTTVTVLVVLLSSNAAFIIQRRVNLFTRMAHKYLIAGMIAPFSFIPAIKLLKILHMGTNYSGLIMVLVATSIPFNILLYVGFFKGLPRELDEAAIIEGCGPLRLYWSVLFPLLRPVVSTNVVLTFSGTWNEFANVLFLVPNSRMWTVPMTIFSFKGFHSYHYGLVCAAVLLAMVPVVAIYIAAQRYIVSGMTAGAVKG